MLLFANRNENQSLSRTIHFLSLKYVEKSCTFASKISIIMETVIVRVKNKYDRQRLINYSIDNGWQAQSFNRTLKQFIDTAPQNVPITDDEILEEIKKVRQNG
jgi:hypothetical protein